MADPRKEPLPDDVVRLVIAARIVAFEDRSPEAIKELDEASEAFADRVPWEDDPNAEEVTPEDIAALLAEVAANPN